MGSSVRSKDNGDMVIDNPELEPVGQDNVADAVLMYRFNPEAGEHIIRLVVPVANRQHMKTHRRTD